jgi:hypothetical protein
VLSDGLSVVDVAGQFRVGKRIVRETTKLVVLLLPSYRMPRRCGGSSLGFRNTQLVHVAARHSLADRLRDGPETPQQLAQLVGADGSAAAADSAACHQ